jgi:hypothetical protein
MENNKSITAVEWLSNQAYELFEQYSEGNFDRITLNKLMLEATEKAKGIEKEQIVDAYAQGFIESETMDKGAEQYYQETFKKD